MNYHRKSECDDGQERYMYYNMDFLWLHTEDIHKNQSKCLKIHTSQTKYKRTLFMYYLQ